MSKEFHFLYSAPGAFKGTATWESLNARRFKSQIVRLFLVRTTLVDGNAATKTFSTVFGQSQQSGTCHEHLSPFCSILCSAAGHIASSELRSWTAYASNSKKSSCPEIFLRKLEQDLQYAGEAEGNIHCSCRSLASSSFSSQLQQSSHLVVASFRRNLSDASLESLSSTESFRCSKDFCVCSSTAGLDGATSRHS